jgi:hypothetical protein
VWAEYWKVLHDVGNEPRDQVLAKAKKVATGKELEGFVESLDRLPKAGIAYFGTVKSRLNYGPLTGDEAVTRDCMDQSKFGTYTVATNKAITIGEARVSVHTTFKRVRETWLVSFVYVPTDETC